MKMVSKKLKWKIEMEVDVHGKWYCLKHFCKEMGHWRSTMEKLGYTPLDFASSAECDICKYEAQLQAEKDARKEMIESGELDEKMRVIHSLMDDINALADDIYHCAKLRGNTIVTTWDEPYAKPQYNNWDILDADALISNLCALKEHIPLEIEALRQLRP